MGMVFLAVNHGDRVDILIKILRIKNDQIFSFHRDLDDLARRKL